MKKNLFIVANRLPVNVVVKDHNVTLKQSDGGLVTAISSYLQQTTQQETPAFENIYWAGVPGCSNTNWKLANTQESSNDLYSYLPVFVPGKSYDNYYNCFSNSVLWPLFHYFPSYAEYECDGFNDYTRVNQQFAEAILEHAKPGDTIWIHDAATSRYIKRKYARTNHRFLPPYPLSFLRNIQVAAARLAGTNVKRNAGC